MLNAVHLTEPVNLDGHVDEAAWDAVPTIHFIQQIPQYGQPSTERSDIFLAYDDQYLYMAGRMYLSDSSLYRATTYKRDALEGSTDYFGFVIDSYNDNENGLAFFTTPTGLRWDGTVSNDALDFETSIGIDWNTYWDVATKRTPYGWSAEMRIPWSSLRFQEHNGEAIKKPLYLTPYALGGVQQTSLLNSDETAYRTNTDPKIEAGLDLKYSLTSNLTLDLTANTDFAQVEVDDQQVNLTRFNLFFPEKRQFFLERASIFDFQFEDDNRLFYSRRIGINDGDPVRIYGGARVQGRIEGHDLGFLTMQTAAPADSLQSENFSVLRCGGRRSTPTATSVFMATNRTDFDGASTRPTASTPRFGPTQDDYLAAKWAQSHGDGWRTSPSPSIPPAYSELASAASTALPTSFTYTHAGRDWNVGHGL
ncbi:MAG: carbohydrate binding family 9 domain-containing protein [Saprospiraceae bacterium]|nr:carbohydrate binding family 9 domain-containing protein [Saprospiraceae bacterium]